MDNKEKQDTALFHIQLLSTIIDGDKYPLVKLIIENHVTKDEYESMLHLLQVLRDKYEAQTEAGFVDFTPLLIHFAGMLTAKLNPDQTIYALKREGYYPSLMNKFIQLIKTV